MESEIRNTLLKYFGTYGLIMFNEVNEYYKVPLPQKEVIKNIYESLEYNPQYENFPNKINYIACCLYLLTRKDETYKNLFMNKVISSLKLKKDPTDDIHLAQVYNCIDFDENFLHSCHMKLLYLSKYLRKFSEYKKEEYIALLFNYYSAILNYRLGKLEEASNECLGIIENINITNSDKIINFIKLKAQIFLSKIYEENTNLKVQGEPGVVEKILFLTNESTELITLHFKSSDQTINYAVRCNPNLRFNLIANKIFEKEPNFVENEFYFLSCGKKINEYKTIKDNQLKEGDVIIITTQPDD